MTNAIMADTTANNIFMDGSRESGDTQSLTVSGTDMSGHYIQGSNGGTANITLNNGATVDMIEVGNTGATTNTTVTIDAATLNGENDGNDSNLLIVFYVQIMPDDFVMQLHRF
ncbi:hypothetical protein AX755_15075 [Enterobacter sp. SENG-6]|nr:hypothetical protein AX755_15075 [Enterobacter sp. SENG-6]